MSTTTIAHSPDAEGFVLTRHEEYQYNHAHQVASTTYANSKRTTTDWICSGPLQTIDENGIVTQYEYNSAKQIKKNIVASTRLDSTLSIDHTLEQPPVSEEFSYDAMRRITVKEKKQGETMFRSFTQYDHMGRPVKETDPMGLVTMIDYSDNGLIETRTLPTGATLVTRYSQDGSILEESGTGQQHKFYTYAAKTSGIEISVRINSEDGPLVYVLIKDGAGRTIEERKRSCNNNWVITRNTYNDKGLITRIDRTNRSPILKGYDEMGIPSFTCVSYSNRPIPNPGSDRIVEWKYEYSLEDCPWDSDSPRLPFRKEIVQLYSEKGNPVRTTNWEFMGKHTDQHVIEARKNTDKYGHSTLHRTEDRNGNILKITTKDSLEREKRELILDGASVQTWHFDGTEEKSHYSYSAEGFSLTLTDARGNNSTIAYNLNNQEILFVDKGGAVTTHRYDNQSGLRISTTFGDGTQAFYHYDERGRKLVQYGSAVNPLKMEYDEAGRLITLHTFRQQVSPNGLQDPLLRDDGDKTQWVFDEITGLQLKKIFSNGSQHSWQYDDLGRMTKTFLSESGRQITYQYTSKYTDKPTRIDYSQPSETNYFTYNKLGQLVSTKDAAGSRIVSYSALCEVEKEEVLYSGLGMTFVYSRDQYGRPNGYELNQGGRLIQKQKLDFDLVGRFSSVLMDDLDPATYNYDHDNGGLLGELNLPFSLKKTISYDAERSFISSINYSNDSNSSLLGQSIQRDIVGQLSELADENGTNHFQYNTRGELIEVVEGVLNGTSSRVYNYDESNNRISIAEGGVEKIYETNSLNQYTTIVDGSESDFVPEYNADGCQTKIRTSTGEWFVDYNAKERPVTFTQGNKRIQCKYDAFGRRTEKLIYESGVLESGRRYVYMGNLLVAEWDITGVRAVLLHTFQWDPASETGSRPFLMTKWEGSGKINMAYLHTITGNVGKLASETGEIVADYEYDEYGSILSSSGNMAMLNPFRFSSEYHDDELGLIYYNYRHYNPTDGRWLVREFLGEEASPNLYGFVRNNPMNYFDYMGLNHESLEYVGGKYLPLSGLSRNEQEQVREAMNPKPGILAKPIKEADPKIMDNIHTALDVAGAVEPTPFCDILNGLLYAIRGEWEDAGISVAGCIPYAGDACKGPRLGKKGINLFSNPGKIPKSKFPDARKMDAKELKKQFGKDVHDVKDQMKKDIAEQTGKPYQKALNGDTNFDVMVTKDGKVIAEGNKSKVQIDTGKTIDDYK